VVLLTLTLSSFRTCQIGARVQLEGVDIEVETLGVVVEEGVTLQQQQEDGMIGLQVHPDDQIEVMNVKESEIGVIEIVTVIIGVEMRSLIRVKVEVGHLVVTIVNVKEKETEGIERRIVNVNVIEIGRKRKIEVVVVVDDVKMW